MSSSFGLEDYWSANEFYVLLACHCSHHAPKPSQRFVRRTRKEESKIPRKIVAQKYKDPEPHLARGGVTNERLGTQNVRIPVEVASFCGLQSSAINDNKKEQLHPFKNSYFLLPKVPALCTIHIPGTN
jgi:hypothetical protein